MDSTDEDGMYSPILGQWTPPPYAPIPSPTESWSSEEEEEEEEDSEEDDEEEEDDSDDSEEDDEDEDGEENVDVPPHHPRQPLPTSKPSSRHSSHQSMSRRGSISLSQDGSMEALPPEERLLLESDRVQKVMSWQLLDIVSWLRNTRNYLSMSLSPEKAFRLSHESCDVDLSFLPSFPPTERKPEHVKKSKKIGHSFESRLHGGRGSMMMERPSGAKTSLGLAPTRKDKFSEGKGDDLDHCGAHQQPRNYVHDHVTGHYKTYSTEDIPPEWYSSDGHDGDEEDVDVYIDGEADVDDHRHHFYRRRDQGDKGGHGGHGGMSFELDDDHDGESYSGRFAGGTDAHLASRRDIDEDVGKRSSPFATEYDPGKRISFVPERDERSLEELLKHLTESLGGINDPMAHSMMRDDGSKPREHDRRKEGGACESSLPELRRQNLVWDESTLASGASDQTLLRGWAKYAGFLQRKKMRESDIAQVRQLLERQYIERAKKEGIHGSTVSYEEESSPPSVSSSASAKKSTRMGHAMRQRDRSHLLGQKETKKGSPASSGLRVKWRAAGGSKQLMPSTSLAEERRMLMDYFNRIHPTKAKVQGEERRIARKHEKPATTMLSAESIPLEGQSSHLIVSSSHSKPVGASYSRSVSHKPGRTFRSIDSPSPIPRRQSQVEKSIDDMLRASGVYVPLMHADRASERVTK